uniref:Uncharacterized protein n=1 Tax=Candidatus Kentrum sp. LPFa TaxID=2126335 RepID=A0A450XES7_9GAMM|nr:MAG: hypothetical protein BECKLPF1236C_GA0070990_1005210 [Candidatus Kentron sp. LPFa]
MPDARFSASGDRVREFPRNLRGYADIAASMNTKAQELACWLVSVRTIPLLSTLTSKSVIPLISGNPVINISLNFLIVLSKIFQITD